MQLNAQVGEYVILLVGGVEEADSVVLLVDGKAGLQAGDREVLDWLRTNHPRKKVHLAVNKCDNVSKADLM
eukprot:scaffold7872_cov18-Tisochrysis_lutea.AAC.2